MKRYVFLASFASLAVVGAVLVQQNSEVATERSVEFNIAELSPNGADAGYAMPASGGSPPTSVPGCAIAIEPQKVDFNDKVAAVWLHGTVPGESVNRNGSGGGGATRGTTGGDGGLQTAPDADTGNTTNGDSSRTGAFNFPLLNNVIANAGGGSGTVTKSDPVPPALAGVLEGISPWGVASACLAYCNLDDNACDPNVASQWTPVDVSGSGSMAAGDTDSQFASAVPGVANAGSGGRSCNNATAVSKDFLFTANKSGNYVLGMAASYRASYAKHHSVTASNTCYETFAVNTDDAPELKPEVLIDSGVFAIGKDVPLKIQINNIGTGGTDHRLDEDGLFNYRVRLDVNNDGFSGAGVDGDLEFDSGDTLGPLARQYHLTDPYELQEAPVWSAADVVTGTHGIEVCVDTNNKVTEIQEGNNCATGVFTVEEYDVASYSLPGTYYAVYGEPLSIVGYVLNVGSIDIAKAFKNQIEIQLAGGGNNVLVDATTVTTLASGSGIKVSNAGIDHKDVFGPGSKNLEYRIWADTDDDLPETAPDNLRPDTVGNNDSAGWSELELVNPEIYPQPVDRNGTRDGYWGPFVYGTNMDLVFDMHNQTPYNLPIKSTFDSVLAIDNNNDCAENVSLSNSCIDHRVHFSTNGIDQNGATRRLVPWTTKTLGVYRAKVFADTDNDLDELNESNNTTQWQSFEVVESLPGEEVLIDADPLIIRKGDTTNITWDVGLRSGNSCRILRNNVIEMEPLSGSTGSFEASPNITSLYDVQCDADGTFYPARKSINVQVLPVLYES